MSWFNDVNQSLPEAHQAFASLDAVWQLQGKVITTSSLCEVLRVELDGKGYYVKRYRKAGENALGAMVKSKARREWENLMRFKQWGLPVAEVVACGEESLWSWPRRGALVTAEIENSKDLAWLADHDSPLLQQPNWVDSVSRQVAQASAVMHQHSFAHNDWKWRNILVAGSEQNPQIYMIDCPAGTFWWGPFFEYRRIKDIACLDKIAQRVLNKKQRIRFYQQYQNVSKLSPKHWQDIAKILRFFKGRE
ncbi:lipopolysaccharide kinase InaA family protein [Pseudomaricurvus sp.]|uniref:lipopolysaccharide kinase InaA family protein n=1 Tax=Pseudomaricurvus sp. TaxID=2004510 RepID=UPI003F6C5AFE